MTDEEQRGESPVTATPANSVRNELTDNEIHGPVVQAGTILGGVHYHYPRRRLTLSSKQVWRTVRIFAVLVCLSAVAAYLVKREQDDTKFSSPPHVCDMVRKNPNLKRWVPGAKEGGPYKLGPGTLSCTWDSPSEKSSLAISVTLSENRKDLVRRFEKWKSGKSLGAGEFTASEPALGDEALWIRRITNPATSGYKPETRITSLYFRRYNVKVDIDKLQYPDGSSSEWDNLVREIAAAIDAYLMKT